MRRHSETRRGGGGIGGRGKKKKLHAAAAARPLNKLEGISVRTFLDLDPQEAGGGQRSEPAPHAEGPRARGVPLARARLRGESSAGGRPPTPAGVARAGAGHNGPAGRADRPSPAAGRERETGGGGGWPRRAGRRQGREPGSPGAQERGFPTADPTKTRGAPRPEPCPAGPAPRAKGGRFAPLERPGGAIMGGGGGPPIRPTRGRDPPPRRSPRHRPRAPSRPPGPPAPAPARGGGGAGKPGAPRGGRGRGGGESWVRVCFILPGWLRAHPRGRTSWPGEPGPPRPRSGRPGAAPRCARRVPPRASARAQRLGLSFLLPPARSLAPGAWIDLVALASGSRSRPASTLRLPIFGALARPPARSLTRAPARRRRPTRDPLQIPDPAGASAGPAPPPPPPAPRPAGSEEKTLLPLPPSVQGEPTCALPAAEVSLSVFISEMFIHTPTVPTEPHWKREVHFDNYLSRLAFLMSSFPCPSVICKPQKLHVPRTG